MKLLSEIGAIGIVVISGLWLYAQPGFESLIVFLMVAGTIGVQAHSRLRSGDISTFLRTALWPITSWINRRRPLTSISFDTLSDSSAVRHQVRAYAIWDDHSPTLRIELRHKRSRGTWATFANFDGHHVQLDTKDIDGDGNPELLVRYACGAHTRVIMVFQIGDGGLLELIPGEELGSDWPEIELKYHDHGGKTEIHLKQRNWNGGPTQEFLLEVYVYEEGRFVRARSAQ